MEEQKKKKIDRGIFAVSTLLIICTIGYIIYTAVVRKEIGMGYYVVLFLFLGAYWFLNSVLSIILTKAFETKSESQQRAYRIYALLELAGLAGLGYFAVSIGNNTGIYGVVVYAMAMMWKRKYLDEYRGVAPKEEDPEQEEGQEQSAEDQEQPAEEQKQETEGQE